MFRAVCEQANDQNKVEGTLKFYAEALRFARRSMERFAKLRTSRSSITHIRSLVRYVKRNRETESRRKKRKRASESEWERKTKPTEEFIKFYKTFLLK